MTRGRRPRHGGRIAQRLRPVDHPLRLGLLLTGDGAVAAVAQTMALLLRHWWPAAAAAAAIVSRGARRAVLAAAVADVVLEYRRDRAHLDPVRFAVARRLDDLAYGAGVWWSALRARSLASLTPAVVRGASRSA